jgi:hypothetical protein
VGLLVNAANLSVPRRQMANFPVPEVRESLIIVEMVGR